MVRIALAIGLLIGLSSVQAYADEQIVPLAADGDWIAAEHRPSITDPPDICLAMAPSYDIALRTHENDNELRFRNESWSLPAGITGSLIVAVNGRNYSYTIIANTNTDVSAVLSDGDLQTVVADMNVAASMTVTAGSSQPATIPLDGSKEVVTAYLSWAESISPDQRAALTHFQ